MKKLKYIVIIPPVAILILSLVFVLILKMKKTENVSSPQVSSVQGLTKVVINEKETFYVEVADTDEERAKGLSGYTFLENNKGKLFIFPKKDYQSFWMKDMIISIDIIWIADNKIVWIHKNVQPEPGVVDSKLKLYQSPKPIDFVLELNAGTSDKFGFKEGMDIEIVK